ncbi:MAG: hypothetical protein IJP27_08055 [Clostridia bacterium]|nr:hypothetical protein [Clostridia bacterium]
MKRILCILIALLLLMPAAHAEGEFAFCLNAVEEEDGKTVTVTGSVENAPTCASYRVIMTYDTAVLKPVEGKNAGSAGLFIVNINAKHQEKPAVNALAADAAKVLEGTQDLFAVTFELLGTPPEDKAAIEVAYQEFFAADLSKQTPAIKVAGVLFPEEKAPEASDTPTEEPPKEEVPPAEAPDTQQPDDSTEEPPADNEAEEPTLPDGNWAVDEKNEEVIFVPESGEPITYVPQFPETIEPNTPTDIPLKDENGNDAGSITVEKQEDGSLKVIEQNAKPPAPAKKLLPVWAWGLIGVGIVVLAGAIVLIVYTRKEKKEHE